MNSTAMKNTEITIETKKEGNVWAWFVMRGAETMGGGYCATKRDALNDADIFAKRVRA